MPPRYAHPCPACRFLGQHKQYDLYFHEGRLDPYYLIRYNEGCDAFRLCSVGVASRLNSGEFEIDDVFIEAHRLKENGV
jgi:hypothetical protein